MMDDKAKMRPISKTVLLDSVPCGGVTGLTGCGRECPMMFRDDWLEEVPAPPTHSIPSLGNEGPYAKVRDVHEIRRTLDARNMYRGLMFMPEMLSYSGKRFPILKKIERVWTGTRYLPTREPIYLLAGLHCTGDVLGEEAPCDRGCRILWHEDWLYLEPRDVQRPSAVDPSAIGN
jgi:hypothetical protein